MDQFLQAQILKADLITIDTEFTKNGVGSINNMVLLKQSLVSIANVFDFQITIRYMYKNHPILSESYKVFQKECEFAKYLRNKFVGHLKQELVSKTLEWNPMIRVLLNEMDDSNVAYAVNQLVLETAINTYVDRDGNHMLFDSETDLNYPPDNERFLKFLTLVIRSSISFLNAYLDIKYLDVKNEIEQQASVSENMLSFSIKAAKTEFQFIKK